MMRLFLAFLCSAVSFPAMLFERALPIAPTQAKIAWQWGRGGFHNLKNLTTETIRADVQWWSKALSFVICAQMILIVLLGVQ